MKSKFNSAFIIAMLFVGLIACNQKKEEDKTDTKMDNTTTEVIPGFDASMDATTTSGYPARVLADTLGLKSYEFMANPGDSIPMHSHPDHVIYVLEGGMARITPKDGEAQDVEFKTGSCMVSGPQSHSAKNTGTTPIRLLIVHAYRPRS